VERDADCGGEAGSIGGKGKFSCRRKVDDVVPCKSWLLRFCLLPPRVVEAPDGNPAQRLGHGQRQRAGGTLAEQRDRLLTTPFLRVAVFTRFAFQFEQRAERGVLGRDGVGARLAAGRRVVCCFAGFPADEAQRFNPLPA